MDGHSLGERSLRASRLLPSLTSGPPPQVHCISTEFTPRKHGGEKGVPFRVQIDTFKQNENGEYTEHLHSASCQIKVFKVGMHYTANPGQTRLQMALCYRPERRPDWVCGFLGFSQLKDLGLSLPSLLWLLKSVGRGILLYQYKALLL